MSAAVFDVRTAFLIMAILGGLQAMGSWMMLHASFRGALQWPHRLWLMGNWVAAAMSLTIGLRSEPAAFTNLLLSHLLMLLWLSLSWATVRLERKQSLQPVVLLGLALISGGVYATCITVWGEARATAYPALAALLGSLAVAWQARVLGRSEASSGATLMAWAFSLTALVLLVRSLDLALADLPRTSLSSGITQVLMAVGGISVFVLGNLGYLGLQIERQTQQRLQAEVGQARAEERGVQAQERASMLQNMLEERELLIQRLQRLDAVQQQAVLMAALPHELRQPLAALRLNLDSMFHGMASKGRLPQGALQALDQDLQHMGELVERFMALLCSEDRGQTPFDAVAPVNVVALAQSALESVQARAQLSGVSLTLTGPEQAIVDASAAMVRQVLLILLTNALDALADQTPPCELILQVHETLNDVILSVSDNGPGVPHHMQPHLFQPFTSQKDGGMGIGLALAWRLARHCQADLTFGAAGRAAKRPGAVFSLHLPRQSVGA